MLVLADLQLYLIIVCVLVDFSVYAYVVLDYLRRRMNAITALCVPLCVSLYLLHIEYIHFILILNIFILWKKSEDIFVK